MTVYIVVPPLSKADLKLIKRKEHDKIIVVDGAFDKMIQHHFSFDLVVGDFDSVINKDQLSNHQKVVLPVKKDITDTKQAVIEALKMKPDSIKIIGGIVGKRPEHFIANLQLLFFYPQISFMNHHTLIYRLDYGSHTIQTNRYISLFSLMDTVISLKGFCYPLDHYNLKPYDSLGISNELIEKTGIIVIERGSVIVFESDKK